MFSSKLSCFYCLAAILLLAGCAPHVRSAASPAAAANPAPGGLRIMPMGDSITRGSGYGNYRRALQFLLAHDAQRFQMVGTNQEQSLSYQGSDPWQTFQPYQPGHEGYGSQQINQLAGDAAAKDDGGFVYPGLSAALAADKPSVILMMLGTNDVLHNYDPGGPGYAGGSGFAADAAARLDGLVTTLFQRVPGLTLVVATITPLADPGKEAMVEAYNRFIPQIVDAHRKMGQNIRLADMHAALTLSDLSPDGIHPRTQGYDKMARVWFAAMTGTQAPPLPKMPVPAHGPGKLGAPNVFSPADHVSVSNTFTPDFVGANLVDGTNKAFVFGNIADERVSISGFHSAISRLRFFDTPSYTGRTPGSVTVYYAVTPQASLNPSDYIKVGTYALPTFGPYPPPTVGDIFVNETQPAAHPRPSDLKSQPAQIIDFDDLDGLAIPGTARSVLLDFSKKVSWGDGLTEIQAFAPSKP